MTELRINDGNIDVFNSCNPLKILKLTVYAPKNFELILSNLNKFINLRELNLSENKISEIKGLDSLVNLQELYLDHNQVKEIKGLDSLVNLRTLSISCNEIREIKGLDNLVNLQILRLSSNKIKEINGLDKLINLNELYLFSNKLTEMNGINMLINLQILNLSHNDITEITGLDNLINLYKLNLEDNRINELPLTLCNLRNICNFYYRINPIEYIPLPVSRWLDRINRRVTTNNMIYNDKQNVHNAHIQNSFRNSLSSLLRDKPTITLDDVKNKIINSDILTEQTKRELLNYCDDDTTHSVYLITYADLLVYVWARISSSPNPDEIAQVLNQEISDGLCMCFTGRLTRLLNSLAGFYDDIELQISDSEQITNVIMSLKRKITDGNQLKEAVRKELEEREYSQAIISEWLEYI